MIKEKVLVVLVIIGLVLLAALPSQGDDDICNLCDESSERINFGSSSNSSKTWYDVSSVFSRSNQIMLRTDNPWDKTDRPDIVFYASFDSSQNIKLSPEYGSCPCENYGDRATLSVTEYQTTPDSKLVKLADSLKSDGVPRKLWQDLMGPYVYRINIVAPDYGLYATSLLSFTAAAYYAVGEAIVDHYRQHDTDRARICNYVGSIKRAEKEAGTKNADSHRPAFPPGKASPLMALIK